ncbi:hypothetical protein EDD86DRAFT_253540 [Gorgonomyces haynaldii]|nr:hypothetical protein EDD86DRAFT_253540 [Gorgonomyces haynaldii]
MGSRLAENHDPLVAEYMKHLNSKRRPSFLDKFVETRRSSVIQHLVEAREAAKKEESERKERDGSSFPPLETKESKKHPTPKKYQHLMELTQKYYHAPYNGKQDRLDQLNYYRHFEPDVFKEMLSLRHQPIKNFVADFIDVYKNGKPGPPKIHGFNPDTWTRLKSSHRQKKEKPDKVQQKVVTSHDMAATVVKQSGHDPFELTSDDVIARLMCSLTSSSPSEVKKFLVDWDTKKMEKYRHSSSKTDVQRCIELLQRPSESRSNVDSRLLEITMMRLPAFSNLPDFVIADVGKLLTLVQYTHGQVIEAQGENPKAWNVCLSGTVCVTLARAQKAHLVNIIEAGESFGEDTLMMLQSSQEFMVYFLKKIPLLRDVHQRGLKNIADRTKTRTLPPESIIIREGEHRECVFFLKRGTCAVFRTVMVNGKPKQLLLGHFEKYATFNVDTVMNVGSYSPSPYTVVAVNQIEIGIVASVGEWTHLQLHPPKDPFSALAQHELLKAYHKVVEKNKFQRYKRYYLRDLKKET